MKVILNYLPLPRTNVFIYNFRQVFGSPGLCPAPPHRPGKPDVPLGLRPRPLAVLRPPRRNRLLQEQEAGKNRYGAGAGTGQNRFERVGGEGFAQRGQGEVHPVAGQEKPGRT
jgi:hypothetical protein